MIRRADEADIPAMAAILRGWIEETEWFPALHRPDEDPGFLRSKMTDGDVLVAGEPVAGFIAFEPGWVSCLYVSRQARGAGLGKALLDEAKVAMQGGFRLWTFVANTGAQRFYLREGLWEVARTSGDNEEGLPDICYVWEKPA